MIVCFDGLQYRDYEGMGDAVLCPTSCKLHQIAGGAYDLTMVHPIDPWGKWQTLQVGNIIRTPVPKEEIKNSWAGSDVWLYDTTDTAVLRDGPSEPQPITYPAWSIDAVYPVGSKVRHNGQNYICNYYDETSPFAHISPDRCSWWAKIANQSRGASAVATLQAGTRLIWIEGQYEDTWWKMATYTGGIVGYIKQSQLTNEQHLTPEEVQPRVITTQLFRIRKVTVETREMTVTVEAEHVSNDAAGLLIKEAVITQASAGRAVWQATEGLFEPYEAGNIYTNISDASDYTQTIRGKNLIYALLDPDIGIVPHFNAAFKRDNWDMFVEMANTGNVGGLGLKYGKNLLGVNWTIDDRDVITSVVPVAKDADGNEMYLDDVYVDSSRIGNYPVIRMERLNVQGQVGKDDGTGTDTTWTEATLKTEMEARAQRRFRSDHADVPQVEITVDFTMLGDTDEYKDYKALETVLLYDYVRVQDERIGLDTTLQVMELEWDAIRETVTGLKLSNVTRTGGTVTGYAIQSGTIRLNKLAGGAVDEIVDEAIDKVSRMLGTN